MTKSKPDTRVASTADRTAGPPAPPRYLLATVNSGVQIHTLPPAKAVVIGRAPECGVVLDDLSISREHARLEIGADCTITDLGSRNGSQFRGQRLAAGKAQPLGMGESFMLGAVSVLLLPVGAVPPVAAIGGSCLRVDDPTADDSSGVLTAIAQTSASVLISGETGVGKEVLAGRLHRLSGRKGRFLALNCAALSETLLESELFGHEKGAFTGAVHSKEGLLQSAVGGTLLLDEIGEMSPAVQAKMLRAIETQSILRLGSVRPVSIDVRFLAATHRDLLQGTFRRDLYYRLAGFALTIPPLRERRPQIIRLAAEILAAVAGESGAAVPKITPAASLALSSHHWPGNVRELRNVMTRALVLAARGDVDVPHLLFDADEGPAQAPAIDERSKVMAALEACAGNQTRAAKLLGMSRTTFVQKLRLLDIPRPRARR